MALRARDRAAERGERLEHEPEPAARHAKAVVGRHRDAIEQHIADDVPEVLLAKL